MPTIFTREPGTAGISTDAGARASTRERIRLAGIVQGIGLRAWAARHARIHGLAGRVYNAGGDVEVTLEGSCDAITRWCRDLENAPPPGLVLAAVERTREPRRFEHDFEIEESRVACASSRALPPDIPVCRICLDELYDRRARRFGYAFVHCAECGPRASILHALPWDRARTTLAPFALCADCQREYEDPGDRRHHAQGIACPVCGPRLVARAPGGPTRGGDPLARTLAVLTNGGIVAVKGFGGWHLAVDATNAVAVARLRERKQRPGKPFALLVPDLDAARRLVVLSPDDEALLAGPLRPVLVAPRRAAGVADAGIVSEVAPTTHDLGVLLPYAPVHHLLLRAPSGDPTPRPQALVFTSANRSAEPTLADDTEAERELVQIADLLLGHDRAVARPCDDSVFRTHAREQERLEVSTDAAARAHAREQERLEVSTDAAARAPTHGAVPVRLSRAAAPRVLRVIEDSGGDVLVLALGGDLANAPALSRADEIVLDAHVGDLASPSAAALVRARLRRMVEACGERPALVMHDLHPDYVGTRIARELASEWGARTLAVQHHHAHALALAAEHGIARPFLAIVLDGTGLGADGTLWGGEILRVDGLRCDRLAHLEAIPLVGGDAVARAPWRAAAAWLSRAFPEGDAPLLPWHARRDHRTLDLLRRASESTRLAIPSTSCGRLFDAVASLLDLADETQFEAQAAIALEALAASTSACDLDDPAHGLRAEPTSDGAVSIACADLVRAVALGVARGVPSSLLARGFHESLATRLARCTVERAIEHGIAEVALGGGCLQNRLLADALADRLSVDGIRTVVARRVPPSDAGLAVGQALAGRLAARGAASD